MNIRVACVEDAESIASIYNHFVLTTSISFEEAEVPVIEMAGRIADLQASGLPWLVAVLDGVNPASVALHEKLGFEKVAQFKEVGFKFDRWNDVGYWQLLLRPGDMPAQHGFPPPRE